MPNPNQVPVFVSQQQSCMILPLWRRGYDTRDIAVALAIPEYEVANRLWKLRQPEGRGCG